MKQFLSTCLTLTLAMFALVQNGVAQSPNVLDGAYVKPTSPSASSPILTCVRQMDVQASDLTRIDLRQKFNHPFYFPLDPSGLAKSV